VYHFDASTESWKQVDDGLSKVELLNDTSRNAYRVVAVSYKSSQIVINSPVVKQTNYTQASNTFHQWADSSHMYGLNFATLKDAEVFSRTFGAVLNLLAKMPDQAPSGAKGGAKPNPKDASLKRPKEPKKKKGGAEEFTISAPSNFRHVAHNTVGGKAVGPQAPTPSSAAPPGPAARRPRYGRLPRPARPRQAAVRPPGGAFGAPPGPPPGGAFGAPPGPPSGGFGAPPSGGFGPPPGGAFGAPPGPPPGGAFGAPPGPPPGGFGAPPGPPSGGFAPPPSGGLRAATVRLWCAAAIWRHAAAAAGPVRRQRSVRRRSGLRPEWR
jgi:hypothetical protein